VSEALASGDFERIGVVGGGLMGAGIAEVGRKSGCGFDEYP
jgi:3-hydroxyacyl-CoA dehydrogenase